jgi:pimeloyl-ACP methyl ester carboxylesterase
VSGILKHILADLNGANQDVTMSTFRRNTSNGPIVINYEKFGNCGEAVLFVHGGGMDKSSWRFQIDPFVKANFTVYTYDVRGFGNSTRTEFPDDEKKALNFYSYKNDVLDLIDLMDYLCIERGHFIGHSMGGVIVQSLCIYHPDRVLSLTIANSISFSNSHLPHILRTLKRLETKINWCHYNKIKVGMAPETEELLKRVNEIKNPVLIIGGVNDLKTPPKCQKYTKKLLPHAKLIMMPKAGHMSITENAEAFNAAVINFISASTIN